MTAPVRTSALQRRLRAAFLVVAVAFAVLALASQWDEAGERIGDLSVTHVGLAALCTIGSLAASFFAWRETLAGLGDRLPVPTAARIFFLGQLAKYVPGSIWAIVGQMELAKVHGVRRERTATAGIVVLVISLAMGLTLGLLAVPALLDADSELYASSVLLLIPLAVVLHPKVLTWLVQTGLRILKRPALEAPLSITTIWRVAAFSLLSNGLLGLQIWQLAVDVGGEGWALLALAIGGYGLAASVSLVVIPLPAGAGLREAILVLLLAPDIGAASATLVAILARLLLTVADVAAAGLAAAATRAAGQPVAADP
ncbi:flippase-like domain-containing protein [Acidimicrobiia bacterium EGI L10123]|uniref:lysylphosphatidylglycerol synthase domain-containing protein n=1 Tax=Salinilacustrithrix flava TaxID=2957203 RepID=UPI003D7C1CA0|nr:flippase-like domain-containing protein [Acidimicrobiia bacterium EGI L10123]